MEEKITYLFGAGASANALPLVKDYRKGDKVVDGLTKSMRNHADTLHLDEFPNHKDYMQEYIKNLWWLADEADKFHTIDTFAKHCYLTDKASLERLKQTLSLYFVFEQLINTKRDSRYLVFLTSILNLMIFPENIRLVPWNYDFQMELTAEMYRQESFHNSYGGASVHSPPFIEYYPPMGNVFPMNSDYYQADTFKLVHLNGIAGIYRQDGTSIFHSCFQNFDELRKESLIDDFVNNRDIKNHLLTFAWEDRTIEAQALNRRLRFGTEAVKDTTILVVIGYSFPFFNRRTDNAIFNAIKESGKLKKIYFQDPNNDGQFLKNQFGLENVDILHEPNVDQFYIPREL